MENFILKTKPDILYRIKMHLEENTIFYPTNRKKYFYDCPSPSLRRVTLGKNIIFPDIISSPDLLISETVLEVVRMYSQAVEEKEVILHQINTEVIKHYFWIWATKENSPDFYQVFQEHGPTLCVVSLDLAESILRRNVTGITLEEV